MAIKTEIFRIIEKFSEKEQELALDFVRKLSKKQQEEDKRKKFIHSVMGKYKHIQTSSEDFAKRKDEEKKLEN